MKSNLQNILMKNNDELQKDIIITDKEFIFIKKYLQKRTREKTRLNLSYLLYLFSNKDFIATIVLDKYNKTNFLRIFRSNIKELVMWLEAYHFIMDNDDNNILIKNKEEFIIEFFKLLKTIDSLTINFKFSEIQKLSSTKGDQITKFLVNITDMLSDNLIFYIYKETIKNNISIN